MRSTLHLVSRHSDPALNYMQMFHGCETPGSFADFVAKAPEIQDDRWASQTDHLGDKWWPAINFIGRVSHASEDIETLLKRVGAWEKYGAFGWGLDGTERIFASNNSKHFTGASSKTCEYYTTELEEQVEDMFASDYARYDFFGDTAHPQHGTTNGCA